MLALVVAGLSSGHKVAIGVMGFLFIAFALVSSFVLPRRNPNFPGRAVGWYSALGVLFFVAMISAVIVFGKEKSEASGAAEPSTAGTSTPAATTTSGGGGGGGAGQGNATAGKKVFETAGCTGCHTLKSAASTGTVGPNLDQLKPSFTAVQHQVTNGGGGMPPFKGQLSPTQIDDVAAFVSSTAGK